MRKFPLAVCLLLVLLGPLAANAKPHLVPNGQSLWTFTDRDGRPMAGASLYVYLPGTDVATPVYTGANGSSQIANPITLDQRGNAHVFVSVRAVRIVLKDKLGNLVFSFDNFQATKPAKGGR